MTEETPKKRPVGRPSKYKPEYCERVIDLSKQGAGWAEYASEFEVDRASLFRWAEEHEDFAQALTRAKVHEQAWFERAGRLNLGSKEFNANLWGKSVSARFRDDYTERKVTEVSGPDGGAIKTESVTKIDTRALDADQREALKAALMAAAADK